MLLKPVKCDMREQETTIQFNRDSKELHLYTSDNTVVTKLNKLLNAEGSLWKLENTTYKDGEPTGYFLVCEDKKTCQLKAKTVKITLSDEEKQALAQRLNQARTVRSE